MPAMGLRALVPPVATEPLPHGLLGGCIEVVNASSVHELNGTDINGSPCVPLTAWQDCADTGTPDPVTGPYPNPAAKTFERAGDCTYEPVTAVAGLECSSVGVTFEEMRERALAALELGEQRVLEDFVMRRVLAKFALGNDLTPAAGAVSVVAGVGLLEAWLAANYGGTGVIHVPVGAGTLLSSNRITGFPAEDECPTTLVGNTIILGAGYTANVGPYTAPLTPGTEAPADEFWLYATPAMRIRRDTPHVPQRTAADALDTRVNDWRVQAESTFVPELACCIAAAVRVTSVVA